MSKFREQLVLSAVSRLIQETAGDCSMALVGLLLVACGGDAFTGAGVDAAADLGDVVVEASGDASAPLDASTTYSAAFVMNVTAGTQCGAWDTWRAGLVGSYSTVTVSGSRDLVGRSCTGASADAICQAMRTGSAWSGTCDGHPWAVYVSSGAVEVTGTGPGGLCADPAYTVRPCEGSANWGGVAGPSCFDPPSQVLTVTCR